MAVVLLVHRSGYDANMRWSSTFMPGKRVPISARYCSQRGTCPPSVCRQQCTRSSGHVPRVRSLWHALSERVSNTTKEGRSYGCTRWWPSVTGRWCNGNGDDGGPRTASEQWADKIMIATRLRYGFTGRTGTGYGGGESEKKSNDDDDDGRRRKNTTETFCNN